MTVSSGILVFSVFPKMTESQSLLCRTVEMFYATLVMVMMLCDRSYENKQEATVPMHSPSSFEIKEVLQDLQVTAYITCELAPLDTPPAPLAGRWEEVTRVVLTGCSPPVPPYPPAFARALAARGAKPSAIKKMELRNVPPDSKFNASHFEGLVSVNDLMIQAVGEGHPDNIDTNFLQSLPQMKWLSIENEVLPPLTKNVIRYLKLENGRSLGAFGDCNNLYDLKLQDWRVPTGVGLVNGWLSNCKELAHLQAERMELDSLRMVLSRLDKLITLELPSNQLTQQDLLAALKNTSKNISTLRVMNNKLINIDNVLESQKRIDTLDLSRNMLHDFISIMHSIYASRELQDSMVNLLLDHNPFRDFCNWTDQRSRNVSRLVQNLKSLSLVGINTSRVCFRDWKLTHLDLSFNNIEELEFTLLPLNDIDSLVVDLRHNPLRTMYFNKLNYKNLTWYKPITASVTVYTDQLPPFDCDCKNAWLARALREGRVWLSKQALCRGGEALENIPPVTLECDLQPCERCTCRRQWEPPFIIMQCNALGLYEMPSILNLGAELRELHLKGNHINTIRAEDLPATLTLLDLRDNNVSWVDKAASEALFKVSERHVWFAGNPLACDCNNWPLLGALEVHQIQVEDYDNVTCEDGRWLRDLSEEELCGGRAKSTWIWLEKNKIVTAHITCDSAPLDVPPAPLTGRWSEVDSVVMTGCSPPAPPNPPALAQALAARGARPVNITFMALTDVSPDTKFNASHFEGLASLINLTVQAAGDSQPEQLDGNFLQSLPNVRCLSLENEALLPLTKNAIRTLKLDRGRSLAAFGDCRMLSDLELRDWHVARGVGPVDGWLSECKGLTYLRVERMKLDSLRIVLSRHDKLFSLELSNNTVTQHELLAVLKNTSNNIEILRIVDSNLTDIDNILEPRTRLHTLDLSRNMLSDFVRIVSFIEYGGSIKNLLLDNNPLRDFCDWTNPNFKNWGDPMHYSSGIGDLLEDLEFLSLVGTNTSRVCFHKSKLRNLNLSNNNIEELQFEQLPIRDSDNSLVVDLRHNPLRKVYFDESNYNDLTLFKPKSVQVMVYTDRLPLFDCDCENAWLRRALQDGRLWLSERAFCYSGDALENVPIKILECSLQDCQPCTCRWQWQPIIKIVHCDAVGLHDMQTISNLTEHAELAELHLRGNNIDTIREEDLPATLMLLDLRDNNVSRVDKVASQALFGVSERRVWLAGNPLACDCNNWPLLSALQTHQIQVDYENVTCVDGRFLRDVSEEQLCSAISWVWVGTGCIALVGLLALLKVLYTQYERPLKVWLFAHSWCLSYVREEELDEDRHYDLFVSFAHGDSEFVTTQLLPGLENGPHGYKVCVHYRDWMPGELIPTQIRWSVASSRRTVIVLSANFVQSLWGIMEFRAAHLSALAEGRVRLLVVVLEDAPPTEDLPEELRLYLNSTTYLRWDDPWFWQKLRYALPHHTARDTRNEPPRGERVREIMPPASAFELMQYELAVENFI